MKCNVCGQDNNEFFNAKVLNKYDIAYFHCSKCGFLQTEQPYWLEEAYRNSINVSDTGIMARNIAFSKIAAIIIFNFYDKGKKFLDFAGGYGIFTRMMRDIGYDFYWKDRYTTNLVARGFEYQENQKIELLTSFESFEHFCEPMNEIQNMLKISKNVLFSLTLLPDEIPEPENWWYYGLEHGQHISFYSRKTLEYIAKKNKLNLYTNNSGIHLLTEKKMNNKYFNILVKLTNFGLYHIVRKMMKSKTVSDMNNIIKRIGTNESFV